MPQWREPCPLRVVINNDTHSSGGGATSFAFDGGHVYSQSMHVEGTSERLAHAVLPHEITHTVFASHFGAPIPRWADEGGAMCSEDRTEYLRQERILRDLTHQGHYIPLRRLLSIRDYPRDSNGIMLLYAEGFSLAHFLVIAKGPAVYLQFVSAGTSAGWDGAIQSYYGYRGVNGLEDAWRASFDK